MMIELSPNYELFVQILLVMWVLRGVFSVVYGALEAEKPKQDRYGSIDIIMGFVYLLLVTWVMVA